jgi:OmpA-OmpF porin, OOP family
LASVMNADPNLFLRIEGHTDSRGDAGMNLELSKARAEAVSEYMLSQDVNSEQLITLHFGEQFPVRKESSSAALAKNRRVELLLLKNIPSEGWGSLLCERGSEEGAGEE